MQDRMRLDLATVDDDVCRAVLDRLPHADLDVAVWETTTDVDPARPQLAIRHFLCTTPLIPS